MESSYYQQPRHTKPRRYELTVSARKAVVSKVPRAWRSVQLDWPAATALLARRAGGVKGGKAAERSEGALDAAEHRATLSRRRPARRVQRNASRHFMSTSNCRRSAGVISRTRRATASPSSTPARRLASSASYGRTAQT